MKSIVCFGTGTDGHAFISIAENKVEIEYFLDNIQTGQIENYKIYKPSAENCVGKYIVITTTMHYRSIKKQLESYGLCEEVDFVFVIDYLMRNSELLNRDFITDGIELHLFLRKRKATYCALQQMAKLTENKELIFETYKNAVILPLKKYPEDELLFGRGGVVEQSGRYVRLSGIEYRIDGKYDFGNPKYRDERVVYGGYLIRHWGHFLIEVVARLWYFLENDDQSDKYVFFINSGEENVTLEGNYKEFFRLLGILDKVEIINEPVQYKEVIVPQMSYVRASYYSNKYKNIFSAVIASAMRECKEQQFDSKVYFTRSHWGKTEFGLDMLDDFFEKNGFKVICPETLPLTQMIYALQKADVLAAVSGSTPHNIMFGKDGQELIIIERCAINNGTQVDINRIKQLNVTHIDANMDFYPVSYGGGPFLLYCNKFLKSFAEEKQWDLPDKRFMSETYVKDNIKAYVNYYAKIRTISDRYRVNDVVYREAYMDSMRTIKMNNFDLNYMIKSMEVSIVISVHNSEKFLKECIKSILLRTIGDIEMMCIDGTSTDVSFDAIKELQEEDNRIIHMRDVSTGCEYKSNFGISMTIGKYIVNFESDDKFESDLVENLYDIALDYDAEIIDENYGELLGDDDRMQNSIMQINFNDYLLFKVFVHKKGAHRLFLRQ